MALDPNRIAQQAQKVSEKGAEFATRATLAGLGAVIGIGWGITKAAALTTVAVVKTSASVLDEKVPGIRAAFSDEKQSVALPGGK